MCKMLSTSNNSFKINVKEFHKTFYGACESAAVSFPEGNTSSNSGNNFFDPLL